ncbi:MAG: nucleotide-binding domain containing protein [Acetobacteraceae bacterium]
MTSRPLVAFYGDDLTGPADKLSVLAEAGLTARLYLVPRSTERVGTCSGRGAGCDRDRRDRADDVSARDGPVLEQAPVRRLGFCGGDTASLAVRTLGVRELTYAYRLAAGVPVSRVHHPNPRLDGLLIMLKGRQMGPPDLFVRLASGAWTVQRHAH